MKLSSKSKVHNLWDSSVLTTSKSPCFARTSSMSSRPRMQLTGLLLFSQLSTLWVELTSSSWISFLLKFFFSIKWTIIILILLEKSSTKTWIPLLSLMTRHMFSWNRPFLCIQLNPLPSRGTSPIPDSWPQSLYTNPDCTTWLISTSWNAVHIPWGLYVSCCEVKYPPPHTHTHLLSRSWTNPCIPNSSYRYKTSSLEREQQSMVLKKDKLI